MVSQIVGERLGKKFEAYEARVNLVNFGQAEESAAYFIQEGTTIAEILAFAQRKVGRTFLLSSISVTDERHRAISHQECRRRISTLDCLPKELTLTNVPSNCYFAADARLLETANGLGKSATIQQVAAGLLEKRTTEVLVYNPEAHCVEAGRVLRARPEAGSREVYRLQAEAPEGRLELLCSKEVLLLAANRKWAAVKGLRQGDAVYGLSGRQELVLYRVVSSEREEEHRPCYSVSSPKYGNVVLNGLVVHNRNFV
jgi:hypothetical protein